MITKKQVKPQVKTDYKNPLEALGNLTGSAVKSLGEDFAKKGMSDFWQQLLGKYENPKTSRMSGDLSEGQELNLSQFSNSKQESMVNPDIAPEFDYRREILYGSEKAIIKETQVISQEIQNIIFELKQLAASSKQLEAEFKDVVVEQRITKPGKYHQSFFSWMLTMIRTARARVENAGACLAMVKNKSGKKQQQSYWNMFKTHGTTFGLSNERVVATQTG